MSKDLPDTPLVLLCHKRLDSPLERPAPTVLPARRFPRENEFYDTVGLVCLQRVLGPLRGGPFFLQQAYHLPQ